MRWISERFIRTSVRSTSDRSPCRVISPDAEADILLDEPRSARCFDCFRFRGRDRLDVLHAKRLNTVIRWEGTNPSSHPLMPCGTTGRLSYIPTSAPQQRRDCRFSNRPAWRCYVPSRKVRCFCRLTGPDERITVPRAATVLRDWMTGSANLAMCPVPNMQMELFDPHRPRCSGALYPFFS